MQQYKFYIHTAAPVDCLILSAATTSSKRTYTRECLKIIHLRPMH